MALVHLTETGIISSAGYSITALGTNAPSALTVGTNIPMQKDYSGLGFIFVGEENETTELNENFVLGTATTTIGAGSGPTIATAGTEIFKGEDALAIDAKMDDGVIDAGDVRGFNGSGGNTCLYNNSSVYCTVGWKLDIPTDI